MVTDTRARGRSVKTMPKAGKFLAYSPTRDAWLQVERFDFPGYPHAVIEPYSGKWFTPTCWTPLPIVRRAIMGNTP